MSVSPGEHIALRVSAREPDCALQRQVIKVAVEPPACAIICRSDEERELQAWHGNGGLLRDACSLSDLGL